MFWEPLKDQIQKEVLFNFDSRRSMLSPSPLESLRPHWYRYVPTDIVTPPLISLRPHWYRYVPTDIVTSPLISLRPHWYRYVPTNIVTSPLISLRPHWYRYVPIDIVTSPLISLRPHFDFDYQVCDAVTDTWDEKELSLTFWNRLIPEFCKEALNSDILCNSDEN